MDKGVKGGECNRTVCKRRPATHFNRSTEKYLLHRVCPAPERPERRGREAALSTRWSAVRT